MTSEKDARYKNAEQAIVNAFWRLMETDGFDVMTATQIIQSAGVNRSTFYAHYADKHELLNKQVDQLIGKLTDAALTASADDPGRFYYVCWRGASSLFNEHRAIFEQDAEKYQTILPEHAELLCSKFGGAGMPFGKTGITETLTVPERYVRAAVCGMISSLIVEWLGSEGPRAPEQFADVALSLIAPLAHAVTSG